MDTKMESYINHIVNGLGYSKSEKEEMKEEIKDHLQMLKKDFMNQGYSEKEASEMSIQCFGEKDKVKNEFKKVQIPYKGYVKILFSVYILFLLFNLFNFYDFVTYPLTFKTLYSEGGYRGENFIPFYTISQAFTLQGTIQHIILQMIVFIPLGIFIPLLWTNQNGKRTAGIVAGSVAILLVVRYIIGVGSIDVDDLIINLSGSMIGYVIYKLFKEKTRDNKKINTVN